jgi:hypothetical protein
LQFAKSVLVALFVMVEAWSKRYCFSFYLPSPSPSPHSTDLFLILIHGWCGGTERRWQKYLSFFLSAAIVCHVGVSYLSVIINQ